ncbi:uncharacterized protein V6R79_024295 [Siganus canaliculatus]
MRASSSPVSLRLQQHAALKPLENPQCEGIDEEDGRREKMVLKSPPESQTERSPVCLRSCTQLVVAMRTQPQTTNQLRRRRPVKHT